MRETLARWVALLTTAVTVSLSVWFAWIHNPSPERGEVRPAPTADPVTADHPGRAVYDAQRCAVCHSIAGVGSPRSPLDGVGARRDREELEKWIVGAAELEDALPPSTFRRKQAYQALPQAELDALVAYLATLRE